MYQTKQDTCHDPKKQTQEAMREPQPPKRADDQSKEDHPVTNLSTIQDQRMVPTKAQEQPHDSKRGNGDKSRRITNQEEYDRSGGHERVVNHEMAKVDF